SWRGPTFFRRARGRRGGALRLSAPAGLDRRTNVSLHPLERIFFTDHFSARLAQGCGARPVTDEREAPLRRRLRPKLFSVCLTMKPVGEPDAGDRHVRFDERGWETERCRMAQVTAPILDSALSHLARCLSTCPPSA